MTEGERGSISVVAAGASLVVALLAAGATDLGAMLIGRVAAQTAADAAALAAASGLAPVLAPDADPTERARAAAEMNGATLIRCACTRGASDVEVEVERIVRARLVRAWDGARVRATARAELDADVYSYRG